MHRVSVQVFVESHLFLAYKVLVLILSILALQESKWNNSST